MKTNAFISGWRGTVASLVLMAASLATGSQVHAQTEEKSSQAVLEEVIVTARKREESLQETPVAVSAFGAGALQKAGIRNLADFNKAVPGLDVNTTNGNAPNANIFIRGVGQRNVGANIDSGVGIYLDGIYLPRADGALLDISDVQSVQILRGPQGTLFGKNTTGGAVVFTTNRPAEEFGADVSFGVGRLNDRIVNGMLNVPLTDKWLSRLSFFGRWRDGFIDNEFLDKDFVDEDRQAAIFKLRYLASDDLTVDIITDYSRVTSSPRPAKCKLVPGITGWLAELVDAIVVEPSTGRKYVDFCRDASEAGGGDPRSVESSLDAKYLAEVKGISLQFDWNISDALNFKSITGFRNTKAAQDDDIGGTSLVFHRIMHGNDFVEPRNTNQYSQEFQLTGDLFDGRMQYVSGLYYFQEETDGSIFASITVSPMGPTVAGPETFTLLATATETLTNHSAAAAFSQIDWEILPKVTVTAGIRYTTETRELNLNTYVPDPDTINAAEGAMPPTEIAAGIFREPLIGPFEFNPNFSFLPASQFEDELTNDAWTPMFSLRYLIEDWGFINGGSVYATWSKGFLSGGLNESTGGIDEFKPEKVTNIEAGVKLDMWNQRLRVNASVFDSDYTDRQLTTIVIDPNTSSPVGANLNAEESRIRGVELETTLLATENLMLLFNGSWNDGDIQKFTDTRITLVENPSRPPADNCNRSNLVFVQVDECTVDRADEDLPRLARTMAYVAVQYTLNTDVGRFVPRIEGSFKRDIEYCFDRGSCLSGEFRSGSQKLYGANLAWFSRDEQMRISVFGSNLTNEDFIVGGIALTDALGTGTVNAVAPRLWGAEVAYSW